jgi:hypothetical protein
MNKHLGNYVRQQRKQKGIRLGPLAERLGYKNRRKNRGCRMILEFEREGIVTEEFLVKLIGALELDEDEVSQAMAKDLAEWEEWVSEPIPIYMISMPIPAVNFLRSLPTEIKTQQEAEEYARNYAKNEGNRVCLVLSRRESVWIESNGDIRFRSYAKPGSPNIPYATLGGRRKFLLDFSGGKCRPVVLDET